MAKIDDADVSPYIDELRHAVSVASMNYDVWWSLKNENRELYADTMNQYLHFFATSINAHFVATLIPLYRLYENKADTYNIPKLLEHLRQSGRLPAGVIAMLDTQSAEAEPHWKKISILRNRAFGHRSRAHTTKQLFDEAQIEPDSLKELIALSKELLNVLSQAWQHDVHAFNLSASADTDRLLRDLLKFNPAKGF